MEHMKDGLISTTRQADEKFSGDELNKYQVLARKYRPYSFSGLIGQDFLVRILKNSLSSGRIAHAFLLSGVRGIGKTTTARILARALNCVGPDGTGGPTIDPCGKCTHCLSIGEDRHIDVLEIDAASRTGVDGMRDLIDGVPYLPTSARYKIYIVDEVHMLSRSAFNALLKTLEEPPPHVKFIFATTEIKKIPVTVLSRCQRFDLARVDVNTLIDHFLSISAEETINVEESAIRLIARAADGSVRDGLSLLDQAMCQSTNTVEEDAVRNMLGLADRTKTFDLLELIFSGDIKAVLELFDKQYFDGANPIAVCEDLLEIVNFLTRIKVLPSLLDDDSIPEIERSFGDKIGNRISMAFLARSWQILLKGLSEIKIAPSAKQAADMVFIRLTHASDLPTPDEAVRLLQENAKKEELKSEDSLDKVAIDDVVSAQQTLNIKKNLNDGEDGDTKVSDGSKKILIPETFEQVLALADQKREAMLRTHLLMNIHLVHFEVGKIELRLNSHAPPDLVKKLTRFLVENTSIDWDVSVSSEEGSQTLYEQRKAGENEVLSGAKNLPLVRAVLEIFPEANVEKFSDLNQ